MKGSAITGPVAKECVRYRSISLLRALLKLDFPQSGGSLATYRIERGNCRMSYICPFVSPSSVSHSTLMTMSQLSHVVYAFMRVMHLDCPLVMFWHRQGLNVMEH